MTTPANATARVSIILRSLAIWMGLVIFVVWITIEFVPASRLTFPHALLHSIACGSPAAIAALDFCAAAGSSAVVVSCAEMLFGRRMSRGTRLIAAVVLSAVMFGVSFASALLLRGRFASICA